MRAVTVTRPGNAGVLETADRERPTAGPGQVLVRVGAAGVNYMDIYQRAGTAPLPTPFVAGVEGAGEVVAVGQGVTDPAKGRHVAWLSRGQGSYAEYVAVDAAKAVPVLQVVQEAGRVYVGDAHFLWIAVADPDCLVMTSSAARVSKPQVESTRPPTGRGEHPSRPGTSSVPGTTPSPATSSSAAGRRSSPC